LPLLISGMTSTTAAAPKRRKGASKKSKKSWRKNTDIDDVNEFLEDQRLEERLGGAFDERHDDELFVVDKGHQQEDEGQDGPATTRRAVRKKAAAEKPLRCHQNLTPEVAEEKRQTPGQRPNPIRIAKEKKLKEQGIVKAKEKLARKHRDAADAVRRAAVAEKSTRRRTNFDFDLWDEATSGSAASAEAAADAKAIKSNEWLEGSTKTHNLKGLRMKAPKVPKDLKRGAGGSAAAVETPSGGESYNPSFKDHQDLLWKATLDELKKERAENKVDYHTTQKMPKRAPTEAEQVQEMTEGLFDEDDSEEEEEEPKEEGSKKEENGEDDDDDEKEEGKKGNKPKTKKQKRKERARKAQETKLAQAKKAKMLEQDFSRLKSIKKALRAEDEATARNAAKKVAKKAAKLAKAGTLSNYKFEEPELDVKLSEELTGNLRNLRPEGNLLTDRFKSLQKRRVIETRVKQKVKRKAKNRKLVEKRNHKMGFDWEKK